MRTYDDMSLGDVRGRPGHQTDYDSSPTPGAPVTSRLADANAVLDLQQSAGNAAVVQLLGDESQPEDARSPVLNVVGRGGGEPLDQATRTTMEAGLGADFRDVRVHTDGAASSSAQAVQAAAYTVGTDVVFQSGQYQPETCLLYTSPSPRDLSTSRMPSSA